jgi:predicted phage tail protein
MSDKQLMLDDKVTVVYIRNPFDINDRIVKHVDYKPTHVLKDYVSIYEAYPGVDYKIGVNSAIVDNPEQVIQPGDFIGICPVIGGDKGKNVIAIVAMIAVMVVAVQFGMPVGQFLAPTALASTQSAIGTTLIMMAGGMLVNMVLAPPVPKYDFDSEDRSPTYGWDTLRPSDRAGGVIPTIYGKHRVGGTIISKYVDISGNDQTLNLAIAVCDHEVTSITDIWINKQPVTNFADITTVTKLGTLSDSAFSGFDKVYSQTVINSIIEYESPITKTIGSASNPVDGAKIYLICPYGCWKAKDDGSLSTMTAPFTIEYKKSSDSSWTTAGSYTIEGKTYDAIRDMVEIDFPSQDIWDVKITRTAEATTSSRAKNTLYWDTYTSYVDYALSYPGIAGYSVKALATDQLSGGIPEITALVDRQSVQVYNPNTTSWETKSANNPAWAAWDHIYQYVGDYTKLVYDDFASWATYCDEEISTGDKRFTLNLVIDSEDSMWVWLTRICAVGRATPL